MSRTGHYKWIIVGSIAIMGFAVLLMTQLTKDTPVPVVWIWMFIAGLGVGTTFSVPTIVIQNAVPFRQLGVATSNLTFFRQIGGTIALAFVGTIFATSFQDNLIPQMSAAGVPQQVINGFTQASSSGSFDFNSLTGVGDLGAAILKAIPPEFQAAVQPFIGAMVEGVHGAFSLATAQAFWLGVFGSVVAFAASLAIKEIPLRTSNEQPVPTQTIAQTGSRGSRSLGQARARLGQHRRRRLTFAPPRTRRPRWTPPGPSFVRGLRCDDDGPATRQLPAAPHAHRARRTTRSRPCSPSPTCRPARCAG